MAACYDPFGQRRELSELLRPFRAGLIAHFQPRALPWAILWRPVGPESLQFTALPFRVGRLFGGWSPVVALRPAERALLTTALGSRLGRPIIGDPFRVESPVQA